MKNIFFVSGLAFYDILCLISFILNAGLRFWLSPVPFHYTVYYPVTWPIQQIAHTGNTLCTVLLCADRYMEICWQEKAQTWFTKGKTKIYLAFISFFCLLFNVPTFFELEWGAKGVVKWTDLMKSRNNSSYFVIYNVWLRLIIRCALPVICLVILSSLVVIKVISKNISCSPDPTTKSKTKYKF